MNDLKGIIKDLSNSMLVDNDFFLKLGLSDEEADNSYNGCTTEGEIIIMLKNQQQELAELKSEKTARWKIISNRHSSYFQCMNCFATIHGEFSSKFEQRGWIEENPYCRKCGAKMEKE